MAVEWSGGVQPHIREGNKLFCACHHTEVMDLTESILCAEPEKGTNPERRRERTSPDPRPTE